MADPESDAAADDADEIVAALTEQAEDLCHLRGHIAPIIANLDIDEDWFTGYDRSSTFSLESVVRMFLYQRVMDISQEELKRRLRGASYVYVRFEMPRPPTQGAISYNWRERFSLDDRLLIKKAARRIRELGEEHDLMGVAPALDPEEIRGTDIEEETIMDAVGKATELGFDEFSADRASNAKFALEAYFERQGYLNMAKAGTTTPSRRFARLSERDEVPHGSSHNRTMKKVADPNSQTDLDQYTEGQRPPDWKRIRDEVLPAFHAGVEKQLDEIAGRDRKGLQQPVKLAIDITHWNFWPSPFRDENEVDWREKPTLLTYRDGSKREVYPKEDYPKMVSGLKESHERGYKFATVTVIAEDTPIVVGIEPVRDNRWWESDEIETRTRGELVDRLLEQAEQHVDIHKVFADREFDKYEVRDVIDRRGGQYVLGKRVQAKADKEGIRKTASDPVSDVKVEHATLTVDGRTHDVSIMYVPKDTKLDQEEIIEENYAIFTTNAEVSPDRAMALTTQYRKRWQIENEYKSIKNHFLPTCASKDYRIRFLYFVVGVMMYNVWRLANFVLRDEVNVDLGEKPPLRAGEIVELVGFCLFDPGG
ncbi:transposase [Natronorubrum sp. DTA7]|uniref:transposase n=1 Tax=Natronorubrum sp. DTA7 TaxID=3447016 RepID=UPI003F86B494